MSLRLGEEESLVFKDQDLNTVVRIELSDIENVHL